MLISQKGVDRSISLAFLGQASKVAPVNPLLVPVVAVILLIGGAERSGAQIDYNEVGRELSGMLDSHRLSGKGMDAEQSEQILQRYLEDLDPAHLHFSREDVAEFRGEYGRRLHEILAAKEGLKPATEIYQRYTRRIGERVEAAVKALPDLGKRLDRTDRTARGGKEVGWAPEGRELAQRWENQLSAELLDEMLRQDGLERISAKDFAAVGGRPEEVIAKRYRRQLQAAEHTDAADIANYFLSAVARSYDPHSDYLSTREMERFRSAGSLAGIGVRLESAEDGAIIVRGIMTGGTADTDGRLQVGDRIVAEAEGPDGPWVDVIGRNLDEVVPLIRGRLGSEVRLMVEPAIGASGEVEVVMLSRALPDSEAELASAEVVNMTRPDGSMIKVGRMIVPAFYLDFEDGEPSVSADVGKLLARLKEAEIDGLLMDLRRNSGGSLDEAGRIAGFFLGASPVVQVRQSDGRIDVKCAPDQPPLYEGPLVTLTDRATASAAEVLAGVLQDHGRAVVAGSSTFGKGTMQQPMELGRLSRFFGAQGHPGYLKTSTLSFYRFSGRSLQWWGVKPDIELPTLADALHLGEAWLDHALPGDLIRPVKGFELKEINPDYVQVLALQSRDRLRVSPTFEWIREDIARLERLTKDDGNSLNLDARRREVRESEARKAERIRWRREHFDALRESDQQAIQINLVRLENLAGKPFLPGIDQEAKRAVESRTPQSGSRNRFVAATREGLEIVADLVELTGSDAAR